MSASQSLQVNDVNRNTVAYAFMAALNNREGDLVRDVYLPMFCRALSSYSQTIHGGKDTDAKAAFVDMYGIDMPVYMVRQMLRLMEKEMSRAERRRAGFSVFEKGKSFTIADCTFANNEAGYQAEARKTRALQDAFTEFIAGVGLDSTAIPSLHAFIDQNRLKLASFFNKNHQRTTLAPSNLDAFSPHAQFFQLIEEKNQALFEVAESLFMGSVIAAYLESGFDLSPKFNQSTTFYLDTQFVLRALDLQQEEETRPAVEVVKMISSAGGKLVVSDLTREEIERNIQSTIDNFSANPLVSIVSNQSIIHACVRRGLTKTDLQNLLATLDDHLSNPFSVHPEPISKDALEAAKASEEHIALKNERHFPGNALHDVACIQHVRRARGGRPVMSYQKVNAWFVTSNGRLYAFNLSHRHSGCIPEAITPEELASLLWLQNPSSLNKSVGRIGLDEMVAQALVSSLAPMTALAELDNNLHKYAKVTPAQYAIVAQSLAAKSSRYLNDLNQMAASDPGQFSRTVLQIFEEQQSVSRSKDDQLREQTQRSEAIDNKYKVAAEANDHLLSRMAAIEQELVKTRDERSQLVRDQDRHELEMRRLAARIRSKDSLVYSLVAIFVGLILLWVFLKFIDLSWLRKLLSTVTALGGLWGCVTMCINIYRLCRK